MSTVLGLTLCAICGRAFLNLGSLHSHEKAHRWQPNFWAKVERSADGCWRWTGAQGSKGYGSFRYGGRLNGKTHKAHRVAYELERGPIPGGLDLDHLCRNRICVNPAHLEPVTRAENLRRGEPASRTHCPKGHPYDSENTRRYARGGKHHGGRQCWTCHTARRRVVA